MKCPYCQKEMQLGQISNWLQPIQWIPDGQKPSLFSFFCRTKWNFSY